MALAAIAVVVIAIVVLSSGPSAPPRSPDAAVPPGCAGDSPAELRRSLGRRIIVRMEARATPDLLRQARDGEIGGVVVFPPENQDPAALGREIAKLQAAASEGGAPTLLVTIDQEGGEVKRLPELPPALAPPELAADPAMAEEEGLATGEALAELGVNVDLAPVLDVPSSPDSFVATRAFGEDPASVAEAGGAFARGLEQGGVAATAKHFPGLGRSPVNTDLGPSEVAAERAELEADLAPFEAAIAAGIDLVMLSNAIYPTLDPRRPAFASTEISETMLREQLGYDGATITDDLEAGGVRAAYDREAAALAAARAGTDLLLFALTSSPDVLDALVVAAESGRLDPGAIEASCVRIGGIIP